MAHILLKLAILRIYRLIYNEEVDLANRFAFIKSHCWSLSLCPYHLHYSCSKLGLKFGNYLVPTSISSSRVILNHSIMASRCVRVPSSSQISAISIIFQEGDGEAVSSGSRKCNCGLDAKLRTSTTVRNPERRFYGCPNFVVNFFKFSTFLQFLHFHLSLISLFNFAKWEC